MKQSRTHTTRITRIAAGLLALYVGVPAIAQLAPSGNPGSGTQAVQQEFNTIYEVGADGTVTGPSTWVDLAALVANHTISADQRESIEAAVRDWLAGLQTLVIENADLALVVAQGLFESVDMENQSRLRYASDIMKSLGSMNNLTSQLTSSGVLSNEQGEMNRRILQDLARARNEAISARVMAAPSEDQQGQMQLLMARSTMNTLSNDAMVMFGSIAVRGAPLARSAIDAAGLDASALSGELSAVAQAGSDDAKKEAMIALMSKMGTIDLIKFSKALGAKLPPVKLPELDKIGTATAPESAGG